MFDIKIFVKEYKKNKNRYNKWFTLGLACVFLVYSIGGFYAYNWKINAIFVIIVLAYIKIWDAIHPIDKSDEEE